MLRNIVKDACFTAGITILLLGPILSFVLDGFTLNFAFKRTFIAAGIVFLSRLSYLLLRESDHGKQLLSRFKAKKRPIINVSQIATPKQWIILAILFGLLLPFILSKYWLTVAILALIYILLGLGLNIVVGLAGLLNLGFVAFYAVGAYTYALSAQYLHFGFWTALPFGALLAGLFGALLGFPVLRMYGDYLAIVTLGFGEIVRLILTNWAQFTGGPNGISVPPPTLFGLEFSRNATQGGVPFHEFFKISYDINYRYFFIYFVLFSIVCLVLRLVSRLQRMPMGRAWEALREDEIASQSLGINHVTTKLSAFSLGAMIGGIGGVFFAAFEGFVNPTSFTFVESALILAIVVLGGMGSVIGVTLAAIILTILPELLREFAEYRMLIFGLLMVLMMIWRPQGLIRIVRQWIPDLRQSKNE